MKRKLLIISLIVLSIFTLTLAGCSNGTSNTGDENANAGDEIDYPTKPIQFIVPWTAGGSSDQMARAFSSIAEEYLGQPLVIVNRDGAGATIGTTEVKAANPDGYTIMLNAVGVFTSQPKMREVSYTLDDFEAIIGTSYEPLVMAVNANSEFQSFDDLLNTDKTIKYGSTGAGSLLHLSQAALFGQAELEAEHVPYQGGSENIAALLGNHVDVIVAHPAELTSHESSGKIKMIGLFSPERFEDVPEVPTFKEMGYDLDFSVWKFILAPKGIDPAIQEKLTQAFADMMQDPKFLEFADNINISMDPLSPEEVIEKLENETEVTGKVIDDLGLTSN